MKTSRIMRTLATIAIPLLCLTLMPGAKKKKGDVRASLEDGQVLYGDVKTGRISLESDLGVLKIPLEDIGEVVPVEGDQLGESEHHVRVWLRDGSELVGQWKDPEMAINIKVGKDTVKIDVPTDKLNRFQTQGGEVWPKGMVYRVRTTHGDDFLVNAKDSHVTIQNELGEFSPRLSDCVAVRPVDDPEGDWRIELGTGTVLIGALQDSQLTLAMSMGPDTVTVPLASFVSMNQQSWAVAQPPTQYYTPQAGLSSRGVHGSGGAAYESWDGAAVDSQGAPAMVEKEELADESPDGWFKRHSLKQAKDSAR